MAPRPDSYYSPEATGRAKVLVDLHQSEQPLKLYARWFCLTFSTGYEALYMLLLS
ncbi:unnamed protein product [Penicillium salamii]|nr:unnamed protein product [Penicillium salamii]